MNLLEEWEAFSGIWPRWGLSLAGEVYALQTWAPATADRESSFWPTSRAEDWSTPGAHDSTGARGRGFTLTDHHYRPVGLENQAEFWASPQARDYRSGETLKDYGNSRPLSEQAPMWNWPTITVGDSDSGQTQPNKSRQGGADHESLRVAAAQWKTPHGLTNHLEGGGGEFAEQATTREPSHPARQIPGGLTFWQRVRILLLLCRQLRRALPSPYNKVRSMFKRKLNPDFVDWLMGWPIGFTSEGRVFSAEEMELYRFRQRQSLRCLLGE